VLTVKQTPPQLKLLACQLAHRKTPNISYIPYLLFRLSFLLVRYPRINHCRLSQQIHQHNLIIATVFTTHWTEQYPNAILATGDHVTVTWPVMLTSVEFQKI